MRAHLNSRGPEVWKIAQDANYAIPRIRVSQEDKDKYYANNRVVDILLASLCCTKFDRVGILTLLVGFGPHFRVSMREQIK